MIPLYESRVAAPVVDHAGALVGLACGIDDPVPREWEIDHAARLVRTVVAHATITCAGRRMTLGQP